MIALAKSAKMEQENVFIVVMNLMKLKVRHANVQEVQSIKETIV